MKKIFCLLSILAFTQLARTQIYIVQFNDKATTSYSLNNPQDYLSQRAIDRRARYNIHIDSTDLPVAQSYIDGVRMAGDVTVLNTSRWLNAISISVQDPTALNYISTLPFVKNVLAIAYRPLPQQQRDKWTNEEVIPLLPKPMNNAENYYDYGFSFGQVHLHRGSFLHNIGLRGEGMIIGMLDAGFQNYETVEAFDSARANGQILQVYDFVANDSSVNEDHPHGMQCFSTIAANLPGTFVGTAPNASFYLFRSEDASSEYPIEEFNWVCAAERVDSSGGDVISSSLGYNFFDANFPGFHYTYADLDGNTTMAAIGADFAAKKGLLVVNSAGNEGAEAWHHIVTPADGDSVLAVGAVNSSSMPAGFSSYGPAADGRIKPDVASLGVQAIVQLPNNTIGTSNGTSFAAPNLAGLATCLWQGFPEFNNMQIIRAIQKSGHKFHAPDNRVGYGIPDMKNALLYLLSEYSTASASVSNCVTTLQWSGKDLSTMRYEIERMDPGMGSFIKVAEQPGTGLEFGNRNYQITDQLNNVPAGMLTYRIRQVIDTSSSDFTAGYIDTVKVSLGAHCGFTPTQLITPMPNPAFNDLHIRVNIEEPIHKLVLHLYDGKGQLVLESVHHKGTGVAGYRISIQHLPKGKYYVVLYNDMKKIATEEVIKL